MYDIITTLLAFLLLIVIFVAVAGALVMLFRMDKSRESFKRNVAHLKRHQHDDDYYDVFRGYHYRHLPSNIHYDED